MNFNDQLANLLAASGQRYIFNAADGQDQPASIEIFGEIDEWFGYGVRQMAYDLSTLPPSKPLLVKIHSPGGQITEGIAIRNLLKSHPGPVTTQGIGFVASIASVVLLSGSKVEMADNSFLMIHRPWMLSMGQSDDLRESADLLDIMENNLIDVYHQALVKNGKADKDSKEKIKEWMNNETWFTAQQALEAGLIDGIAEGKDYSQKNPTDQLAMLDRFEAVPKAIYNLLKKDQKMEKEKSLLEKMKALLLGDDTTGAGAGDNGDNTGTGQGDDGAIDVEAAKKALEDLGYKIQGPDDDGDDDEAEKNEAEKEEMETVLAVVKTLKDEIKALKSAQAKAGAGPSGGSQGQGKKPQKAETPRAKQFEGFAGTLIKWAKENS